MATDTYKEFRRLFPHVKTYEEPIFYNGIGMLIDTFKVTRTEKNSSNSISDSVVATMAWTGKYSRLYVDYYGPKTFPCHFSTEYDLNPDFFFNVLKSIRELVENPGDSNSILPFSDTYNLLYGGDFVSEETHDFEISFPEYVLYDVNKKVVVAKKVYLGDCPNGWTISEAEGKDFDLFDSIGISRDLSRFFID